MDEKEPEAADAYMQIRGAQARLNFAKDQVSIDEHLVELVQQRRDAGIASDRELAQAQALLSQASARRECRSLAPVSKHSPSRGRRCRRRIQPTRPVGESPK